MYLSEAASSPEIFNIVPWIVFFPLIGLLINLMDGGGRKEKFVGTIASLASFSAFVVAVILAISLSANGGAGAVIPLVDWIVIGDFSITWAFQVDTLSVTMMLVVSGIGTLIHIYAAGYMFYDVRYKEDTRSYQRFFIYLNLFIAFMMILVSGSSYLMLFVGWEGVGLCSFLLIGFWYDRNPDATTGFKNSDAAKKAFVANRVGDFGFLIAMFLTFWQFGSLAFEEVFRVAEAGAVNPGVVTAIALFMLIGVAGKSAQIPLYVWLPDAMAGPTPVSALIHAATMVTAGVYLVARSAPLFEMSAVAQNTVATVGAVTALFAATIAVGQYDVKKVLAYSTVSQLGFMVAAVGMGAYVAGMFHLVTHAFFKALLFLGSGSIILGIERGHHPLESTGDGHGHHGAGHDDHHDQADHGVPFDPQDMRNMGGLRKTMPVTFWVYMAGTLALAGIFPFAGFWSKDEILADAAGHYPLVFTLLTIAAFLTAFYMGRQVFLVFFGDFRSDAAKHAKESPKAMTIPLIILALLATFGGALNIPKITESMESFKYLHMFGVWIEHTLGEIAAPGEFKMNVAINSTIIAVAALVLAWLIYGRKPLKAGEQDPLARWLGPLFTWLNNKWYVDEIYGVLIIRPYERLAAFFADALDWNFWHDWFHDKVISAGYVNLTRFLADPIDVGIIDRVSRTLAEGTGGLSRILSRVQSGFVRNYALTVFGGVVLILSYIIFR